MIIDDTDGLQVGVDDRRTYKFHSAFFEIFADGV